MTEETRAPRSFLAQGDTGVTYTVVRTASPALALKDGRRVIENEDGTYTIIDTGEILTRR